MCGKPLPVSGVCSTASQENRDEKSPGAKESSGKVSKQVDKLYRKSPEHTELTMAGAKLGVQWALLSKFLSQKAGKYDTRFLK